MNSRDRLKFLVVQVQGLGISHLQRKESCSEAGIWLLPVGSLGGDLPMLSCMCTKAVFDSERTLVTLKLVPSTHVGGLYKNREFP